jgi:hypothetical protein
LLCALTVRQLQAGSFEQFAEAFRPSDGDRPPSGWMSFTMLRDTADENRVVTFGFFDGTLDELQSSQEQHGYEQRRDAAGQFVEEVLVNGVFDVVAEMKAG